MQHKAASVRAVLAIPNLLPLQLLDGGEMRINQAGIKKFLPLTFKKPLQTFACRHQRIF
jgi:hypothetical protein